MNIQPLNNNVNNVNFGFNAKLNEKLIRRLTTHRKHKPFCESLLKLNTLTNETEALVRKAEAENNQKLLLKLASLYVDMKGSLSAALDFAFPKLHYGDNEAATFAEEIAERGLKNNEEHWLNATLETLNMNNVKIMDISELSEEVQESINKHAHEDTEAIEKGKELAREYIPTEEMKKGFAALGGMKELKEKLNDRIVGMLKDPEQARLDFEDYGKKMPKGILMYGPPGCGKTTIIEALSTEADVPLLKMEVGKLGSPYIHEMSTNIDAVFDYAESRATSKKPVVLFVDDADALFGDRGHSTGDHHREELSTFLNRIQKSQDNNVVVIAATNRTDLMDEAIKSRFEEQIEVPLPDKEARKSVIKLFMSQRKKGLKLANDDKALTEIADKTDKFSIRTIKNMAEIASMRALKDGRRDILKADFEAVIKENQHQKVNADVYKKKGDRTPIGFRNIL